MPATGSDREGGVVSARERWVAFAFTGADLLVEATPDGIIGFAAGPFRLRFGVEAERFVGQRASMLIAPPDQAAFEIAIGMAAIQGRTLPVVLHLNEPAHTPCAVAAMMVPGPSARLCLTFGPVAVATPAVPRVPPVVLGQPSRFAREAEAWLRGGGEGSLGLVEVPGWGAAKAAMSAGEAEELRAQIGAALAAAGPGALAGELGEGRFGVLAASRLDTAEIARQVEAQLSGTPIAGRGGVAALDLRLAGDGLTMTQAVRALRYALGRFAQAGSDTIRGGAAEGLPGIIAGAQARARGLRTAIGERHFGLSFQPVASLEDAAVHHFEALLRPVQAVGGVRQSPQDFVTFAEAVGLAEEMDAAVLEQSLKALRASPSVAVAVNVSGQSMQSAAFRTRMLALIRAEADIVRPGDRTRLIIELTETADIEDVATAAATIQDLRMAGVPVCIDDFGAGNAAFRYLRDFKVDFVKIDGSYVHGAGVSDQERGFVAAMVQLAKSVGARVIAEMIETEAQAALMRQLQVHFGQGWLFGRPGKLPGALKG